MNTRLLLAACCVAALAACDACGATDAPPAIPSPSGAAALGEAPGSALAADAPTEPEDLTPTAAGIVHTEPPTAADFAVPTVDGDWTMVRGATHRSGLRDAPAIERPRVAWSIEVGIQGYANTPIVTADGVWVSSQGQTHNSADEKDGVYRLDVTNGAILWHYATPIDANGMTLVDGTLVVGTDSGTLHALDPETGAERWVADVKCRVYQAPEVRDGWLYLLRTEGTIRVRVADGTIEGAVDDCRRSERGMVSLLGDRLLETRDRAPLHLFEANGRTVWQAEMPAEDLPGFGRWTFPQQTASMLIETVHRWPWINEAGTDYRPVAQARWQDNGQIAWQIDINDPEFADPFPGDATAFLRGSPWIAAGRLFWTPTNAGRLVAYDIVTGERLDDLRFDDCRGRQFASIVGTPTMGYLARHDGLLYAFRPDTMEVAWRLSLGLHGVAGTTETHSPVTGACTELPKNGTALFATPAIAEDGRLYVGAGDGWIYAIDHAT
jgi:outer membrane protein assembly factor BamB